MSSENTQKRALQTSPSNDANDANTHQSSRKIDPNVLQRRASMPDKSVWVSASAGTGKTKVLTDRVLRLLLPRENTQPGSPAHKILCLTFTKAAASEMALRISETLRRWAVMPETDLKDTLKTLLGREPSAEEKDHARRLFADVVDVPGGLKIMTIHAFCQSLLGRFPLEARVNPQFTVLEDDQAGALMNEARAQILADAEKDKTAPGARALDHIARTINEDQFLALLGNIARERSQFQRLIEKNFDLDGLYTALCAQLSVRAKQNPEDILKAACEDRAFEKTALLSAAKIMSEIGSSTDKTSGKLILDWLEMPENGRLEGFSNYKLAFLKKDEQPRAKLATKKSTEANPEILDVLEREALRLITATESFNAARTATLTRDILILGSAVLEQYTQLKKNQSALDFDDLILKTLGLLSGASMGMDAKTISSWVHYKLDQGLEHILVDEAQDTNPEQWQIIAALCEEFFLNTPDNNTVRTVFTVGDEKQSIYSFQRASPEEFSRMQNDFRGKTLGAQQDWDSVPMNISFRGAPSVLKTVDAVFADMAAKKGLGELPVEHSAFRRGQAGLVELWPAFESDNDEQPDLWTPVKDTLETQSGRKKLALHIAQTVKDWLDSEDILESKNRPVRPGDIMILVRTRAALVGEIARELKNLNIPVSGLDRMVLSEELAVQDLLAGAQWTLQPLDNLTLACVLKSPLIGLTEEELYSLSAGREGESLWSRVGQSDFEDVKNWLSDLQTRAKTSSPFDFFTHLLQTPCPADTISGRRAMMSRLGKDAMDPLDELLNIARNFEQNEPAALQNFVHHQASQTQEIKRQQHSEANEVQIMTIHGAKGLQAPIVILPDTISGAASAPNRAEKRLLWPGQTGLNVPLWSPRKDMDCETYKEAMAALDERLSEEYRRLLYVAMTRAEDRLYIGGALNKKQTPGALPEGCWYQLIQNGLESLQDTQKTESGGLQLSNPQIHEPDGLAKQDHKPETDVEIPGWLHKLAPPEDTEAKVFRPSQLLDTTLSPLKNAGTQRFLRGNLTHKLLQLLPELPKENWTQASTGFIKRYGSELAPDIRADIVKETLNVLNHPDFAPIFSAGSLAEVPLTGMLEGKGLISAQIDRLCITDDTIWIIDYKTNRPPPEAPGKVPQIYQEQMQTYAALLHQIYEGRTIKGALLWTDGPFLMPLDLPS